MRLVNRLGQRGLAIGGGALLALAYLSILAIGAAWWLAPIAVTAIGLGYSMLHNTLQTNATQMAPQARGNRGRDLLLGDLSRADARRGGPGGAGVRPILRGAPVPRSTAAALAALGWWFARASCEAGESADVMAPV